MERLPKSIDYSTPLATLPDGTVNQNIAAAERSLGRKLTDTERTQAIEFIKNKIINKEYRINYNYLF
jgi:hypothetical protein